VVTGAGLRPAGLHADEAWEAGEAVIFITSPECKSRPVSTHALAEESWTVISLPVGEDWAGSWLAKVARASRIIEVRYMGHPRGSNYPLINADVPSSGGCEVGWVTKGLLPKLLSGRFRW
jgi:hypothetical protein